MTMYYISTLVDTWKNGIEYQSYEKILPSNVKHHHRTFCNTDLV